MAFPSQDGRTLHFNLKSMLDLRIKCSALSEPGQEAIAFAARLREGRGNPIPSTSDTAPACRYGGRAIEFLALLELERTGQSHGSQD